jgi:hypothetical protein
MNRLPGLLGQCIGRMLPHLNSPSPLFVHRRQDNQDKMTRKTVLFLAVAAVFYAFHAGGVIG